MLIKPKAFPPDFFQGLEGPRKAPLTYARSKRLRRDGDTPRWGGTEDSLRQFCHTAEPSILPELPSRTRLPAIIVQKRLRTGSHSRKSQSQCEMRAKGINSELSVLLMTFRKAFELGNGSALRPSLRRLAL
jgi:hypothetical protein